jgi:hypothetical protein
LAALRCVWPLEIKLKEIKLRLALGGAHFVGRPKVGHELLLYYCFTTALLLL